MTGAPISQLCKMAALSASSRCMTRAHSPPGARSVWRPGPSWYALPIQQPTLLRFQYRMEQLGPAGAAPDTEAGVVIRAAAPVPAALLHLGAVRDIGGARDLRRTSCPRFPGRRCRRAAPPSRLGAPVLLARQRGRADLLEQRGILTAKPVDLVAGFREVDLPPGEPGQHLADADRRGGLLGFALQPFFQAQQGFQVPVGK